MNTKILNILRAVPFIHLSCSLWATNGFFPNEALYESSCETNTYGLTSDDTLLSLSKAAATIDLQMLEKHAKASCYGLYPSHSRENEQLSSPLKNFCDLALALRDVPHYPLAVLINDDASLGLSTHQQLGLQVDFCFFRNTIDSLLERPESIPTLKAIYPETVISSKIWDTLEAVIREKKNPSDDYIPRWFNEPSTLDELALGSQRINSMEEIRDGDTLVGVGNTPQFLLEFHKSHGQKNLNYIQVALSGSPGTIKESYVFWFQSILTEEGLKNYRSYLKEIGLIGHKHQGRIFFMDIIGSGGGPKFIMNEYLKDAITYSGNPEAYMLGINGKDQWADSSYIQGVGALSLNMNDLAKKLDCIPDTSESSSRSLPHFPANKWTKPFSPPSFPHGEDAQSFINKIKSYKGLDSGSSHFSKSHQDHLNLGAQEGLNLRASLLEERDHDHLNPIELAVFEGKTAYAQEALLHIKPTFDQVQSMLNTLILHSDNITFCQWLVDTFKAKPDQIQITDFDTQYTDKEINLGKLFVK
jgi:hypothetical protein